MSRRKSPAGLKQLLKNDGSWLEILLAALAELLGSAILVFIGCMACVGSLSEPASHLQISLTFGFTIASIVHIIGHISHSHINPVVSICSVILGLKSITTAAIYILAHFLGAIIGYGMLRVITPLEYLHTGNTTTVNAFCVTTVNENISSIQGLLVETMATGILILFVCACYDPRNSKHSDSKAIKFGLVVAMLAMACGPYTGCSMNPARSFAPALWNNKWTLHWIYWMGPISGTVFVSFAYKNIFWPKKLMKEEIADAAVLNSVDVEKPEVGTDFTSTNDSPVNLDISNYQNSDRAEFW